jgi:hypothetical protein
MRWAKHVIYKGENERSHKILVRSLNGRLRLIWKESIKTYLKQGMRMWCGLI